MKDRVPGSPGRYTAVITADAFKLLQDGKSFPITLVRDDDPIDEGTPYSKAAVLPDSVAAKICPDIEDPTPADAFASLLPLIGGTMTGSIAMGGKGIKGLGSPTEDGDAVNLGYANNKFRPSTWTPTASDVGAVNKSGDTMTGNLTVPRFYVNPGAGGYPTIEFCAGDIRSAFVQQDIRDNKRSIAFYLFQSDQDGNATQYYTAYNLQAPLTGQTAHKVYDILTTRNIGDISSTASASNSYHTAYFAKIGKLVICTLLPKAKNTQALYSETITIPSGYRPSSGVTFSIFSDTAVNAGDSTGKATVSASTGGVLTVAATYGISVAEASKTVCWITA